MADKRLDLITMGRASVDIYGDQIGGRLEDMRSFSKYVGGCPANIAIGTARLGLKTAFLSRVGDEQFGQYIIEHMLKSGVDVSHLHKDTERLTALAILGIKDDETFPLLFYRENCADMAISENDFDEAFIASAKALMVSGTHFSQPNVDKVQKLALKYAKANDTKVVFDIDYRPVLWGITSLGDGETRFKKNEKITKHLQSILPYCDLIIGTDEEFAIAAGSDDPSDALGSLREVRKYTKAALVLKRGELGCTVYEGDIPQNLNDGHMGKPLKIKVFNVLGAGDAFMSGFLRGWLKQESYETCCTWGNASGAIVVTRHGCSPAIPSFDELMAAIEGKIGGEAIGLVPDDNVIFKRMHYQTMRHQTWDNVEILAFDHRVQMAELCELAGVSTNEIAALKQMILDAALENHDEPKSIGILVDAHPNMGEKALWNATGRAIWVGRPVELPLSRPLEFEAGDDIALDLKTWPKDQCIKVLVPWSPNDDDEMKKANGRKLKHLYKAAKHNDLELLIEVIPPDSEWKTDESTVWRAIEEIQNLDVFADWWKLPPLLKAESWQQCRKAIQKRDPVSQGIMVLGFGADKKTLFKSFNAAAKEPFVKGFAVGRTIWAAPALAWLKKEITNEAFKKQIASNYKEFCIAWRNRN